MMKNSVFFGFYPCVFHLQYASRSLGGTHDVSSCGGGGLGVQLGIIVNGGLKTSFVLLLVRLESLRRNSLHGQNKLVSR